MGVSVSVPPQVRIFIRTTLQPGLPGARRNALNVAGVRRAFQPVNQHHRQPLGAHRLRLPVAMAEHAAAVGRVHLDRLRYSRKPEGRPGKKIPHNRLQVAVGEAARAAQTEETPPAVRSGGIGRLTALSRILRGHGNSELGNRGCQPCAVREKLGRLVGIEPTTS